MDDATAVIAAGAVLAGGIVLGQATGAHGAQRRVGGGAAVGIPPAVARRLDVDVDGRRQRTVQSAQRAAQKAMEEHGRVQLGVRDRVAGASVDCNLVAPPRRAAGGRFGRPNPGRHDRGLDARDYAYVDGDGGRHLRIDDGPHLRTSLGRFNQTRFEDAGAKRRTAARLLERARELGVRVSRDTHVARSLQRA